MVSNLADLYRLSVDDLQGLSGFARKSAEQLYEAIQSSKRPRLDRFLYALGIRHVGQHVARLLARHFRSLEALRQAEVSDLQRFPEVGETIASSVRHFFEQEQNRKVLEQFARLGVEVQDMPAPKAGEQSLEGKTFVFTGSLEHYTRQEASARVERLGGRATSSVSDNTDFVVAGANPGRKLETARHKRVKVLDEDAFRDLLGDTV
jgi:DNA ligase (NAD+)